MIFGLVGYLYKRKLKNEYELLCFIQNFANYYNSNMTLFKCDIVEIINKYKIMQNNKNAKFCNLFLKNSNIYNINQEFLNDYLSNKKDIELIYKYLSECGKNEYEFEKEKNRGFELFIKEAIEISYNCYKEKGGLIFKLLLSIGTVIGILIWWNYGYFNFI